MDVEPGSRGCEDDWTISVGVSGITVECRQERMTWACRISGFKRVVKKNYN